MSVAFFFLFYFFTMPANRQGKSKCIHLTKEGLRQVGRDHQSNKREKTGGVIVPLCAPLALSPLSRAAARGLIIILCLEWVSRWHFHAGSQLLVRPSLVLSAAELYFWGHVFGGFLFCFTPWRALEHRKVKQSHAPPWCRLGQLLPLLGTVTWKRFHGAASFYPKGFESTALSGKFCWPDPWMVPHLSIKEGWRYKAIRLAIRSGL